MNQANRRVFCDKVRLVSVMPERNERHFIRCRDFDPLHGAVLHLYSDEDKLHANLAIPATVLTSRIERREARIERKWILGLLGVEELNRQPRSDCVRVSRTICCSSPMQKLI